MENKIYEIPEDLIIGFASASYQIEGGWNDDGKGENIWDRYTHSNPGLIRDKGNGDIACDSYHKYEEDVQLIKNAGGKIYRFSLSWSRILPTGFSNNVNGKGIEYYNKLIDELIKNGIEPMITLFHWDLPQPLQELGGWTNPLLADYFADYAKVAFENFGDRVKKWITFNEPLEFCLFGYGMDVFAPAMKMSGVADYLAAHTVLKAHAKAYHLYDDEYRPSQEGEIGITLSVNWKEAKSPDFCEDMDASNNLMQFEVGWFAHPIFSEKGDYPEILKKKVAENSKKEGFSRSRLPEFDDFWINYIKGTSDFFGVNHYTTSLATHGELSSRHPKISFHRDHGVITSRDDSWSRGNEWLSVVPWGFRKALNWVKNQYNNPVIYITENGYSDDQEHDDNDRINYYQAYLNEMLKAIHEDGCKIKIYTAWTLMDDFEWRDGYTQKFGLHYVDFSDPSRKRVPKKSVKYFQYIIRERKLPESLEKII